MSFCKIFSSFTFWFWSSVCCRDMLLCFNLDWCKRFYKNDVRKKKKYLQAFKADYYSKFPFIKQSTKSINYTFCVFFVADISIDHCGWNDMINIRQRKSISIMWKQTISKWKKKNSFEQKWSYQNRIFVCGLSDRV